MHMHPRLDLGIGLIEEDLAFLLHSHQQQKAGFLPDIMASLRLSTLKIQLYTFLSIARGQEWQFEPFGHKSHFPFNILLLHALCLID